MSQQISGPCPPVVATRQTLLRDLAFQGSGDRPFPPTTDKARSVSRAQGSG